MCVRQHTCAALSDGPVSIERKGEKNVIVWKRRQKDVAHTKKTGHTHENEKA
jgi:hypothetical protein